MKNPLRPILVALAILAVAAVFVRYPAGAPTATGLTQGSMAPEFSLPRLHDDRLLRLSGLLGKVVLVNFWATWCPSCREEIPAFTQVQEAMRGRGFEIVGIALDQGGARDVLPFAMQAGINYDLVLGNPEVTTAYGGIRGIPASFLVDRRGRIVRSFVGPIPRETLERSVTALL